MELFNKDNNNKGSTAVTFLLKTIERKAKACHSNSFLILHKGKEISEWHSGTQPQLVETMSVTKSITGLVTGTLLQQDKIKSLEHNVSDFFPEWKNTPKQHITIRQLMEQSSGLADKPTTEEIYASKDVVRLALDADLMYSPGLYRFYSNKAVNLLPAIVEKASGESFKVYLEREVFVPLGITEYFWEQDEVGNYFGFAGLRLTARDLARLGQLMLQKGNWNGRQLISEDFVDLSTSHYTEYGLLWWIYDGPPPLFAAQGYKGQAIIVCPSAQLVRVRQIDWKRFKSEDDNFGELVGLISQLAIEILKQPLSRTKDTQSSSRLRRDGMM